MLRNDENITNNDNDAQTLTDSININQSSRKSLVDLHSKQPVVQIHSQKKFNPVKECIESYLENQAFLKQKVSSQQKKMTKKLRQASLKKGKFLHANFVEKQRIPSTFSVVKPKQVWASAVKDSAEQPKSQQMKLRAESNVSRNLSRLQTGSYVNQSTTDQSKDQKKHNSLQSSVDVIYTNKETWKDKHERQMQRSQAQIEANKIKTAESHHSREFETNIGVDLDLNAYDRYDLYNKQKDRARISKFDSQFFAPYPRQKYLIQTPLRPGSVQHISTSSKSGDKTDLKVESLPYGTKPVSKRMSQSNMSSVEQSLLAEQSLKFERQIESYARFSTDMSKAFNRAKELRNNALRSRINNEGKLFKSNLVAKNPLASEKKPVPKEDSKLFGLHFKKVSMIPTKYILQHKSSQREKSTDQVEQYFDESEEEQKPVTLKNPTLNEQLKEFHHSLIQNLFALPAVVGLKFFDKNSSDFVFSEGCGFMLTGNFQKAVYCFQICSQTYLDDKDERFKSFLINRKSADEQDSLSESSFKSEESRDQNLSIDSHMSKFRLPTRHKRLDFEIDTEKEDLDSPKVLKRTQTENSVETEMTQKNRNNTNNSDFVSQDLTVRENPSLVLNQTRIKKVQMAYFNLSVCFAKCGYLDKALEAVLNTKVGLLSEESDFHILAKYNKAIFSLLKVPFEIEEALSTLTEVIMHISSKELSHWLNATSLQSNCQSLLVMINKLSIWEMQIMQTQKKELTTAEQNIVTQFEQFFQKKQQEKDQLDRDNKLKAGAAQKPVVFSTIKALEVDGIGESSVVQNQRLDSRIESLLQACSEVEDRQVMLTEKKILQNYQAQEKIVSGFSSQGQKRDLSKQEFRKLEPIGESSPTKLSERQLTEVGPLGGGFERQALVRFHDARSKTAIQRNILVKKQATVGLNNNLLHLGDEVEKAEQKKDQNFEKETEKITFVWRPESIHTTSIEETSVEQKSGTKSGTPSQVETKQTTPAQRKSKDALDTLLKAAREKFHKEITEKKFNAGFTSEIGNVAPVANGNDAPLVNRGTFIKIRQAITAKKKPDIKRQNTKLNIDTVSSASSDSEESGSDSESQLSEGAERGDFETRGSLQAYHKMLKKRELIDEEQQLVSKEIFGPDYGDIYTQYEQNKQFVYRLALRVGCMAQHDNKRAQNFLLDQVKRIQEIRNRSSYYHMYKSIGQKIGVKPESEGDIKNSFAEAIYKRHDGIAFRKLLREYEMMEIVRYKKSMDSNQITDFKPVMSILSKFPFFSSMSQSVCYKLVNKAHLIIYQPGEVIFRQGEQSPNFYFLVRGAVQVSFKKPEWGSIEIIVNSFYDGQQFGEMADFENEGDEISNEDMGRLQQQKYSCQAQESCCIFVFNKKEVSALSNIGMREEFDKRVKFLESCQLFKDVSLFTLLPIANNLVHKKFKFGQFILREGEVPEGLYLVLKGFCRVGLAGIKRGSRSKHAKPKKLANLSFGNKIVDPPRDPFKVQWKKDHDLGLEIDPEGELVDSTYQKALRDIEASLKEKLSPEEFNARQRLYQNLKVNFDMDGNPIELQNEDQFAYKNLYEFTHLQEKDYFGGRVFLTDDKTKESEKKPEVLESLYLPEEIGKKPTKVKTMIPKSTSDHAFVQPSMLSVIANSAEVEVLIMDKSQMSFFPEDVQNEIIARLKRASSIERPYSYETLMKVKSYFELWEHLKEQQVFKEKREAALRKKTNILER